MTKNSMRVLVVGAGAVGGYFGGRLAQAGRDVTFLVRERRATQLREHGLEIVSPNGGATLTPSVVTADTLAGPYDVVLLAVKTYALEGALNDLAAAVGPNTAILPVLNGMRHLDALTNAFGRERVLGGVCIVSTTLDERGRIVQMRETQQLIFGTLDGGRSARLDAVDETLQGAGFVTRVAADIVLEMWEKWVFIAALGSLTCLVRGSVGDVQTLPRGRELALRILDECAAVAHACGRTLRTVAMDQWRTVLTEANSVLTSSMYRDLLAGAPTEADAILGDLCARADEAGVATPLVAAAYAQLALSERKRQSVAG